MPLINLGKKLLIIAITISITFPAIADTQSTNFYSWANTPAGKITIERSIKQWDQIQLDGRPLIYGDDEHESWSISAAYPEKGLVTHILFSFNSGWNFCRYFHKVLEIKADKQMVWSPDFGNCHTFPEKTSRPNFTDGRWLISLPAFGKTSKQLLYIYQDGKIFKNGKLVNGAEWPDTHHHPK